MFCRDSETFGGSKEPDVVPSISTGNEETVIGAYNMAVAECVELTNNYAKKSRNEKQENENRLTSTIKGSFSGTSYYEDDNDDEYGFVRLKAQQKLTETFLPFFLSESAVQSKNHFQSNVNTLPRNVNAKEASRTETIAFSTPV